MHKVSCAKKGSTGNNVDFVKWRVLHPFLDSFSPQPGELEFPFSASKSSIRSWILLFSFFPLFFSKSAADRKLCDPPGSAVKMGEIAQSARAMQTHIHLHYFLIVTYLIEISRSLAQTTHKITWNFTVPPASEGDQIRNCHQLQKLRN